MRALRRVGVVGGTMAFVAAAVGAIVVGCGDDTLLGDLDASVDGSVDGSLPDVVVPPVDGGRDSAGDAEPEFDAAPEDPLDYPAIQAKEFCAYLARCCAVQNGGKFDVASCQETTRRSFGWEGSLYGAVIVADSLDGGTDAALPDGGGIVYNRAKADECINRIRNFSCTTALSADYKAVTESCYAAAQGTVASGGSCVVSHQCQSGHYCSVAAGAKKCEPLKALDAGCAAEGYSGNEQCSYAGGGNGCDYNGAGVCIPLRADGEGCYTSSECASGVCAYDTSDQVVICRSSATIILPSLDSGVGQFPNTCEYYHPDRDAGM